MESCREALDLFLASPATLQSIRLLLDKIPFDVLCRTVIDATSDDSVRDICGHAIRKCLQVQPICAQFCLQPLNTLILEAEKGRKNLKPDAVAKAHAFQIFIEELAESNKVEAQRCLKPALGPMLQFCSVLSWALIEAKKSSKCVVTVSKTIFRHVLLPLFDSEDTGISQMVHDALIAGLSGKILPATIQADDFDEGFELSSSLKRQIDIQILKWQSQKTDDASKNSFTAWFTQIGAGQSFMERLTGTASLDTANSRSASKDVIKVRTACILAEVASLAPSLSLQARTENWFGTIISEIYETNDLLLKLSGAELIVQHLLSSRAGTEHIWEHRLDKIFLKDLENPDMAETFGHGLKLAIIRLLANIVEHVEASRDAIYSEDKTLIRRISECLDWPSSDAHALVHHTTGLSAVASIVSKMNQPGLSKLENEMPEWLEKYRQFLSSPSEEEVMAALTGLLKIVNCVPHDSSRILKTVEEQLGPQIITVMITKPFIGPRELCFKVLKSFLLEGIRQPLENFCKSSELQSALFAPLGSDPPALKYAKHDFVKAAFSSNSEWLEANCDKDFYNAMVYYKDNSAFSVPPQYQNMGEVNIDEAVM